MARTGFAFRQECTQHLTGHGHPERPERLEAIASAFEAAGLKPTPILVEPASRQDLLRVHAAEHVDTIERVCATEGIYPDPDIVVSNGSWEAALLASGGAIASCRAVIEKQFDNAFCAMRPPGHHAEHNHAMGFCLFNNVAVAARWLQAETGVKKIAILDWDVHHGNGTQNSFYDDDSVYYASMHQHPHYPGTGFPDERGKNNTNLNIQMPAGTDPDTWLDAIERIILPEFERFDPDWLLISSGFDAHRLDPLGGQLLEPAHFAEMTRLVRPCAGGRIVSLLEGGYHLGALGESSVAHFQALSA
jgi:acetoin utilization deacetylase AcuC-like enzyme